MSNMLTLRSSVRSILMTLVLIRAVPAVASFNLDYSATGRIWVPLLELLPNAVVSTDRVVGVGGLEDCKRPAWEGREELLTPRDHDCRFEHQLVDAVIGSRMFRRVVRAPFQSADVDLILSVRRSRVQFRRQVIPEVKPLIVLTFFSYLWTPLPFEVDLESYDLRVAVLDRTGHVLSEVAVAREFTHNLSSYSVEREAPGDLLARIHSSERDIAPIMVCRGPHAHVVVHELLQKLGAAVRGIYTHNPCSTRSTAADPGALYGCERKEKANERETH